MFCKREIISAITNGQRRSPMESPENSLVREGYFLLAVRTMSERRMTRTDGNPRGRNNQKNHAKMTIPEVCVINFP